MKPLPQRVTFSDQEASLRRQVRLLALLDACANSGQLPIALPFLHSIAYLSNALAPIWNLDPLDGKVLKQHGAPFYPALQWDLDLLVGRGIVVAQDISYISEGGKWRLFARYGLNDELAAPVIRAVHDTGFEPGLAIFLDELAQAFGTLSPTDALKALGADAAYGDPNVDVSNVVDFAEGNDNNYVANAAESFRPDVLLTPAERVHLYVGHLRKRMSSRD